MCMAYIVKTEFGSLSDSDKNPLTSCAVLASYLLSLRINFSVNKTEVIIFPLKGFEGRK